MPISAERSALVEGLASILWSAAEAAPDHPAFVDRDGSSSYATLCEQSARIAGGLRAAGVRPGDRVVVFLDRGSACAATIFGVYASGGVAVVANERLRPRQVEYLVTHSGAAALVTADDMLQRQPRPMEPGSAPLLTVDELSAAMPVGPVGRDRHDLAHIIYTSGSTGLPKGVVFPHGTLGQGVHIVLNYLGLRPEDRVAALLPFSSVYGLNQLLCTLAVRGTLVVERSPVPQQIVDTLAAEGTTVLAAVPPLWLQLLTGTTFASAAMPSLRQLQNAGGHLPVSLVRQLRQSQPQAELFLQYGQTETFRGTFLPPSQADARPDSMGRPVPGARLMVQRDDGTPCAPGEVGELVHVGPTVAAGYWNDPEATARIFRPVALEGEQAPATGVYSGDMVRVDAEGYLYFVSRRDRLIKTLGFRVGPDEVSDVVHASGGVVECVVSSEPDAHRGERIVAFVVLKPGVSIAEVSSYCRRELPRHMHPARFVEIVAVPRLPSGKYDIGALQAGAMPSGAK